MYNSTNTREFISAGGQGYSPSRSSTTQSTHIFNGGVSNSLFASSNTGTSAATNDSREVQQFTPSFLFGNQQQHTNRRSFATPTRQLLQSYGSPGILKHREPLNSGGNKNVHWSPVLVRERSKSPEEERKLRRLANTAGKSASSTLWNGPPLRSLNDDIIGPPEKHSRLELPEPLTVTTANSMNKSPVANSGAENGKEIIELDVEKDGEEEENVYWVTVFGFHPDQRDDILELFSRHGDIMAQKSPKQGNWMHIRYSSPVHAKQALAKNATIFHGQMVGVAQCKDRDALDDESAAKNTTPLIPQSSANRSTFLNGSSLSMLEKDNSLLLNGSPLVPSTSAYKSAASEHNTSLPCRARLSISSRAGMRPLNSSSFISADGSNHNHSIESSFNGKNGGADDSFIGKIWNMFGGSGANGSAN